MTDKITTKKSTKVAKDLVKDTTELVKDTKDLVKDATAELVKDTKEEKKSSRQQISKLIGINLSVSRVRKHVDKNNVNADIELACAELKALLLLETEGKTESKTESKTSEATSLLVERAYSQIYDVRKSKYDALKERLTASKVAGDVKKLKALEEFSVKTESLAEKIDYVSKLRCRFSNDASVVLSSALDYVVQDIVRTAMVKARSLGKAIIQVQHVVMDDFKSVSVYPLVNQLDVVQKALHNDQVEVVEVEECDDEKLEVPEEDDDEKHGSTFEFYINLICKSVKAKLVESDESYTSIRISKHIRKFCSDVVIQLIERMSPLIKLYAGTAKVKTVNDDVIKFVFRFLLLDAGRCPEDFYLFINERLNTYHGIKGLDK